MKYGTYILFFLHIILVKADEAELPVPMGRCNPRDKIMNDCNWCTCNELGRYFCKTKECRKVDMFGHFNDAIQDIDVGMEGHGVWRTDDTACEANIMYQRDDNMQCVCSNNGTWPNAECRDTFRMLYQVEVTALQNIKEGQEVRCQPTKLYVVGCNVCLCGSNSLLLTKACTKRTCDKPLAAVFEDLLLEENITRRVLTPMDSIYAHCVPGNKYKLDCRTCLCLKKNRLSCADKRECYPGENSPLSNEQKEHPDNQSPMVRGMDIKDVNDLDGHCKDGALYKSACNICNCKNKILTCTLKTCDVTLAFKIPDYTQITSKETNHLSKTKSKDSKPNKTKVCGEGTSYYEECNVCFCTYGAHNTEIITCSKNNCKIMSEVLKPDELEYHCVPGTSYEVGCKRCFCDFSHGSRWETCQTSPACEKGQDHVDITTIRGHCTPGHTYKHRCNTCKCSEDGAHIACSTNSCKNETNDLLFDSELSKQCRPGSSIKFDCNTCYCTAEGFIAGCTKNYCYFESDEKLPLASNIHPLATHSNEEPTASYDLYSNLLGKRYVNEYPRPVKESATQPVVNIIPIASPFNVRCPRGHSYRLKCNYCFCLPNGNTLCTLRHCDN